VAVRRFACGAALFDGTGTLFAPWPSVGAVYGEVAKAFGMDGTAEELDAGFRAAWRDRAPLRFMHDAERRTSNAEERAWWRQTVRLAFEHAGLPEPGAGCFEALSERFGEARSWRLFGDVVPTLTTLREQGLLLGVVSNFDSRLNRICRGLGLTPLLDVVVASAEVGHAKPARAIFDAAVAGIGVPTHRCLMVVDSADADVEGARAAGCQALLLDRSGASSRPDAVHTLAVLPRLPADPAGGPRP